MNVVEDLRQVLQDFVAPELKALDAKMGAVDAKIGALESSVKTGLGGGQTNWQT